MMATATVSVAASRYRWLLLAVAALLAVLPRAAYLDIPFERDEGGYAYVADTISRGGLPYVDAFDHKPPLVYYLYGLSFRLFGDPVRSPRLLAALFVAAACIPAFLIVRRMTGSVASGVLAMFLLGLVTVSPAYTGFNANTEIFTVPFLLGGMYLLCREERRPLLHLATGLLFGLGLVIKPVVLPAAAAGGLFLVVRDRRSPARAAASGGAFAAGLLLPFLVFAGYYLLLGRFDAFRACVIDYNASYGAVPLAVSASFFRGAMTGILARDPVPWAAGAAGAILFLLRSPSREDRWLFALLSAGAAAGVAMGKYFYGHYFVVFVPFLALGAGLGAGVAAPGSGRKSAVAALALATAVAAAFQARYIAMPHDRILATCYGRNPFYQSVTLAEYVKARWGTGRSAYIIGSEGQLLHYAGMRSPARIFYFYPLTLPSGFRDALREETLADLSRRPPELLVWVNTPMSHFLDPDRDRDFLLRIFSLFDGYEVAAVSPFGSDRVIDDPAAFRSPGLLFEEGSMVLFTPPGGNAGAVRLREMFGT